MAKNQTPVEELFEVSADENTEETPVEEPKTKTKLAVVKFKKHYMPYAKGDVAGIEKELADKLKATGIVESVKK